MTDPKAPSSTVTITKNAFGKWVFVLVHKGVTHPAKGGFSSKMEAETVGFAALKALQTRS